MNTVLWRTYHLITGNIYIEQNTSNLMNLFVIELCEVYFEVVHVQIKFLLSRFLDVIVDVIGKQYSKLITINGRIEYYQLV
jgi:hypothetical protein